MLVIRISEATYAHLKKHAKPLEDTPDKIVARALNALDLAIGKHAATVPPLHKKNADSPRLAHKELRIPLLVALLDLGGVAAPRAVRHYLEISMAHRFNEGDYARTSEGAPYWWNAVCWVRINLVKERLIKGNSPRGVWEISRQGRSIRTRFCRKTNGKNRTIAKGTLEQMARRYRETPRPMQFECFLTAAEVEFRW